MDLHAHLLQENSRKNWDQTVAYVLSHPDKFDELVQLTHSSDQRIIMRASQCVGMIVDKEPDWILPYLHELVNLLDTIKVDSFKRNVMRLFQNVPIPEELEGRLFDYGMQYLKSLDEPIAVKAFSMTVVRKIAEKYPELALEAIHQIEILVKENYSAGVVNRGNKELQKLRKIHAQLKPF
jgi:hypothetical protein